MAVELAVSSCRSRSRQPGVYSRAAPALVMVGKWALAFRMTPRGGPSFTALILDEANG